MSVEEFIQSVRDRLDKACPVRWKAREWFGKAYVLEIDGYGFASADIATLDPDIRMRGEGALPHAVANAELIASAPQDLARLIRLVERYRQDLEKIRYYAGEGQWLPCGRCTPAAEMITGWAQESLSYSGEDKS